jgi:methyltransferase-like protein
LLCRAGVQVAREPSAERIRGLYVAGEVQPLSPEPAAESKVGFRGPKGVEVETSDPLLKLALAHLGEVWPRYLPFEELLSSIRARLGGIDLPSPRRDDARELAEAFLRGAIAGLLELHAHPPVFVTDIGDRPVASALARYQIRHGEIVATLRHTTLRIEDRLGRELLWRLDGTRDRSRLVDELSDLVRSGEATVRRDGRSVEDPREARQVVAEELEENLRSLARTAVLAG